MNRRKLPRPFWILRALSLHAFLLLVAILLFIVPVGAQDTPPAETRPVTVDNQTTPTASEAEADRSGKQQSAQAIPPATGTAAKPVKEFKPSETIGADSAVSFPVDI